MKYESDILEMIHENAIANYKIGIFSEADMREYDELCLTKKALKDKIAQGDKAYETVNIEHADLVTA